MSGTSNVAAGRRYSPAVSQAAVRDLQRFDSLDCWNGFVAGDPVKVRGLRGSWRFSAFITNRSNGANWVEVAELTAGGDASGGGAGHRFARTRAFDPDRIQPVQRRKRRNVRVAATAASPDGRAPKHPTVLQQRLLDIEAPGVGGELDQRGPTLEVSAPNDVA